VVKLWLLRRTSDFSDRDRALLGLVAPALERVLRERPTSTQSSLTAQERRVLQHVAEGMSNAEIADRLVVAPCTVRKHLENAYRKLGVTNRLAAVHALEGGRPADTDDAPVGRVEAPP
ncbi:MAG TPA: helix-turn-helix transcriptional regulator, partial [Ornithinibacter sp.]|nr:helix-turn-helix transcriptional regulator [Ornithinibacter sp.]